MSYPQNGYYSSNINNIRGGGGGKGREKKWVKKTRKSKKKWSLKKNRAEKNPKSKKMDHRKKNLKKKHQKNITFLWFKLISSINNNIKKRPAY